jgi:hypothetical protein
MAHLGSIPEIQPDAPTRYALDKAMAGPYTGTE